MSDTWRRDYPEEPFDGDRLQNRDDALKKWTRILLVLGLIATFVMPAMWANIYIGRFNTWGPEPMASDGEGAAYLTIMVAAAVTFAAAAILSLIRARAGLFIVSVLLLAFSMAVAFAFEVPRGRFLTEPEWNPPAHVCYGTSGDCPGA